MDSRRGNYIVMRILTGISIAIVMLFVRRYLHGSI